MSKTPKKIYMQCLVTQQVLVGSPSLWGILLTVRICLEKQIVRCSLPRKKFTAVPFIYSVDLAKDALKLHSA